jgi:hypothetical protein
MVFGDFVLFSSLILHTQFQIIASPLPNSASNLYMAAIYVI